MKSKKIEKINIIDSPYKKRFFPQNYDNDIYTELYITKVLLFINN